MQDISSISDSVNQWYNQDIVDLIQTVRGDSDSQTQRSPVESFNVFRTARMAGDNEPSTSDGKGNDPTKPISDEDKKVAIPTRKSPSKSLVPPSSKVPKPSTSTEQSPPPSNSSYFRRVKQRFRDFKNKMFCFGSPATDRCSETPISSPLTEYTPVPSPKVDLGTPISTPKVPPSVAPIKAVTELDEHPNQVTPPETSHRWNYNWKNIPLYKFLEEVQPVKYFWPRNVDETNPFTGGEEGPSMPYVDETPREPIRSPPAAGKELEETPILDRGRSPLLDSIPEESEGEKTPPLQGYEGPIPKIQVNDKDIPDLKIPTVLLNDKEIPNFNDKDTRDVNPLFELFNGEELLDMIEEELNDLEWNGGNDIGSIDITRPFEVVLRRLVTRPTNPDAETRGEQMDVVERFIRWITRALDDSDNDVNPPSDNNDDSDSDDSDSNDSNSDDSKDSEPDENQNSDESSDKDASIPETSDGEKTPPLQNYQGPIPQILINGQEIPGIPKILLNGQEIPAIPIILINGQEIPAIPKILLNGQEITAIPIILLNGQEIPDINIPRILPNDENLRDVNPLFELFNGEELLNLFEDELDDFERNGGNDIGLIDIARPFEVVLHRIATRPTNPDAEARGEQMDAIDRFMRWISNRDSNDDEPVVNPGDDSDNDSDSDEPPSSDDSNPDEYQNSDENPNPDENSNSDEDPKSDEEEYDPSQYNLFFPDLKLDHFQEIECPF